MQLDHFADAFQNDFASLDSVWGASNNLTDQVNPGYQSDVGHGFAQNTAGYEWESSPSHDSDHHHDDYGYSQGHGGGGGRQPQEFKGNGGYHNTPPTCGGGGGGGGQDPLALARSNLDHEERMHHRTPHGHGPYPEPKHDKEGGNEEDGLVYVGPDAFDDDDEHDNPKKGMPYWRKRTPTALIHGLTILLWVWLWSSYGFSKLLKGTPGTVLYYGFMALMVWGVFQSDHRAARWEEEREVLTNVEGNLKNVAKVVAGAAGMLMTFKLIKGKSQATRYAVYASLTIAFFVSLFGMVSFSARKRGETTRRYRKIKGAALNLSIALVAVAAMLTFNLGTSLSPIIVKGRGQTGGGADPAIHISAPPAPVIIIEPPRAPKVLFETGPVQQSVPVNAAPTAQYGGGDYGGGAESGGMYGGGAPTIVAPAPAAPMYGGGAPTVLQ